MRVLVDTQCWLWLQVEPERFSPGVLELLGDGANELLFSAASSWEIAIKHALGKLALPEPPATFVPSRLVQTGTTPLPIQHSHALRVASLPKHHRDPFDRLIIAQAELEGVPVLTTDDQFEMYAIERLRP